MGESEDFLKNEPHNAKADLNWSFLLPMGHFPPLLLGHSSSFLHTHTHPIKISSCVSMTHFNANKRGPPSPLIFLKSGLLVSLKVEECVTLSNKQNSAWRIIGNRKTTDFTVQINGKQHKNK